LAAGLVHGAQRRSQLQRIGHDAAFCRSSKGKVVEASTSCVTVPRSTPARQSRAASTPMVVLSSYQLRMARSPLARPLRPGANQALAAATTERCSRERGT